VTRPQAVPDRRRVIASIGKHAGRPAPGRPRSPCRGGIASTRAKASCESLRLAPVRRPPAGRLAHHKLGAVCSRASHGRSDSGRSASRRTPRVPNNCPRSRATNRCCRRARANSAARSASSPRRLVPASHASVASTSCLIRSPIPAATSATESRCAARRGCR
jgi:hypothetical protein